VPVWGDGEPSRTAETNREHRSRVGTDVATELGSTGR
jgi:hypothetical protein